MPTRTLLVLRCPLNTTPPLQKPSPCRSSVRRIRSSPDANKDPKGEHRDELVIASGTSAGTRFELANEITSTGRHEADDILLDDVSVSRHHAIFTRTASGRITLRDLNSLERHLRER